MKRATLVSFAAASLLCACHGDRPVAPKPPGISADIVDGRPGSGGNAHFFFLPPLVQPMWPPPPFPGVFNPNLTPEAEVCVLVLDPTTGVGSCTQTVQTFPTLTAPVIDPAHLFDRIQVSPQLQAYFAFWNSASAPASRYYRVTVRHPFTTLPLGFADVQVVGSFFELQQVWQAGKFAPLLRGAPLVIAFRIEQGALGSSCLKDCGEQVVTNNGGTVVTASGVAGARFPQGWLPSGVTQVVVKIDRVTLSPTGIATCIPLELPQVEGCYRFTTSPVVTGPFAKDVTVGICHVVGTPAHDAAMQLYSFEEPEGGTRRLPNVPAPFVSCTGFASVAPPAGGLRNFASQLFRQIEAVVAPTSAFAGHLGTGGLLCCFSRVGWVLPNPASPVIITFDSTPSGRPVAPGTVVDTLYNGQFAPSEGVTFSRTRPDLLCPGPHVYANDHGYTGNGGFGSASGQNVVTLCPEGTASDFSEAEFGRIRAQFTSSVSASQVCIQVWVTGPRGAPPANGRGFLVARNTAGDSVKVVSAFGAYGQTLCAPLANITSAEFAGYQTELAIFDNFSFIKQ
jgi:hypothetical protein